MTERRFPTTPRSTAGSPTTWPATATRAALATLPSTRQKRRARALAADLVEIGTTPRSLRPGGSP
jgi:hypothetical protein